MRLTRVQIHVRNVVMRMRFSVDSGEVDGLFEPQKREKDSTIIYAVPGAVLEIHP